jgi:hypothetical protein
MDMDAFGIIGMIFGLGALYRVIKLEKILKEKNVLSEDYNPHK